MSTRHYITEHQDITAPTACGGTGYNFGAVTDRSLVTCKRCLASLAKRDRAFQRKARGWFGGQRQKRHLESVLGLFGAYAELAWGRSNGSYYAARAIAREESDVSVQG